MTRHIRSAIGLLGAVYELARLAVITRFNFKGEYWQWRTQTAYGRGMPATRTEMLRELIHYARWIHRMRAGR